MTYDNWRKSSYSDGDDGNDCVEIASSASQIAIRDSKTPAGDVLAVPTRAFSCFIEALRRDGLRRSR